MGVTIAKGARTVRVLFTAALVVATVGLTGIAGESAVQAASTTLVISEFRVRGPNGANDEFIEIQNIGAADITVAGGGVGFAVAASNGVARCVIPNGTVIPRYGHYLCVNSVGYSLASYAAGNGTTATGDATYTTDIPDNAGIALFNTSVAVDFDLAHRIDAVGSTSEANVLYKEGTGYAALVPFSIDYSFYRNLSTPSITSSGLDTSTPGISEDTDDNSSDFVFVDTNGTSAGAGQRLGAPGPENLSSPVVNGGLTVGLLDPCVDENTAPNAVRDLTSSPANNSTFGTIDYRRTITNNTGGNVTRLRFRIADQRTFPAPAGFADMRDRTSNAIVTTVDRAPCGSGTSNVTVQGTTLEQPPSQPNGDAFNSSLSAGVVTLATPIAPGGTIDVRMLFGLQQTGSDSVNIVVEALTSGTTSVPTVTCLGATATNITNFCNDPPIGVSDSYTTTEDTPLTVPAPGVLANDSDPELQTLTVAPTSVTQPAHGVVAVNGDGSFTYTPVTDYHGPDSFTYRANDGASDSATTTVDLTVTPVEDPPVAVADSYAATEDTPLAVAATGVLTNDSDIDGDALTAAVVSGPSHGSVALAANGSFTYTPAANYNGTDSFTYAANDGIANSNNATVNLTVAAVNDAPVAVADVGTTMQDSPLVSPSPGPLANDSDVDGDPLRAVLVSPPSFGSLTLAADGSYVYTPFPGFVGTDSFTYAANDGLVSSNPVTITITITALPVGPLPATGADVGVSAPLAIALTLAGAVLLLGRRRRPSRVS